MGPAAFLVALTLWACHSPPQDLAGCAALRHTSDREDCRFRLVSPLVDDPRALDAALAEIDDDASRDLLLLRLAIASPQRAARLCKQTRTTGAQEKCRQVLGRPHLQTQRRPPTEPQP